AHNDFGPDNRTDGHIDIQIELRARVGRDVKRLAAYLTSVLDRPHDIRRSTAGRNAAHHVGRPQVDFLEIPRAVLLDILGAFLGAENGLLPSRDQPLNHLGIRPEGGRTLRRIQNAQSPARSRPHVDKATPLLETVDDDLDGLYDVRNLFAHRDGYLVVLGIDDLQYLSDRRHVDVH